MSVRVIAVDDSEIALLRLERILEQEADLRLVRKVRDLRDAALERLIPCADVLLVDMLMPGRSGLAALSELVAKLPVVVVSDAGAESEIAREALARGARAFVCKRELGSAAGEQRLRRLVRDAAAGRTRVSSMTPVVIVAGSTGAHRGLTQIIPALVGAEARTVVLQHLPSDGEAHFVQWLGGLGIPSQLAVSGQPLEAGRIVVPPAGTQMVLEANARVRLVASRGELHAPSADVLLASAAHLGPRLTAVILSGLGRDGAEGVAEAARAGATVLVQSPSECVAASMPTAALEQAAEGRSLSLEGIARELARVGRR